MDSIPAHTLPYVCLLQPLRTRSIPAHPQRDINTSRPLRLPARPFLLEHIQLSQHHDLRLTTYIPCITFAACTLFYTPRIRSQQQHQHLFASASASHTRQRVSHHHSSQDLHRGAGFTRLSYLASSIKAALSLHPTDLPVFRRAKSNSIEIISFSSVLLPAYTYCEAIQATYDRAFLSIRVSCPCPSQRV